LREPVAVPDGGLIQEALSEAAIRRGIRFAKSINAHVTGLHVVGRFHLFEAAPDMVSDTREQYEKDATQHAQQYLATTSTVAEEAGVPCDLATERAEHPYEGIIAAAEKTSPDLLIVDHLGLRGLPQDEPADLYEIVPTMRTRLDRDHLEPRHLGVGTPLGNPLLASDIDRLLCHATSWSSKLGTPLQ
jgi:nucleotide-binding universal stress UspA family protein